MMISYMCNFEHCSFQLGKFYCPKTYEDWETIALLITYPLCTSSTIQCLLHQGINIYLQSYQMLSCLVSSTSKVSPLKEQKGFTKEEVTSCCQNVSLSYLQRSGANFVRQIPTPHVKQYGFL